MSDRELTVVQKESVKARQAAGALVVESAQQYEEATSLLGRIKNAMALVKAETEKVTRPLLDALNAERARWKPLIVDCEEAEQTVKTKMLVWYNAEQKRALQAAAQLQAKVESGKLSPEKAMVKAAQIAEPDKNSIGTGAASQVRTVSVVYIVDPKLVPDEYWVIDESKVRKVALAGVVIPGVEVRKENRIAGIVQ